MQLLLQHGADVNLPGLNNTTPLHDAVHNERLDVVKVLLEWGADLQAVDRFGHRPCDVAESAVMRELLEAAAAAPRPKAKETVVAVSLAPAAPLAMVLLPTGLSKEDRTLLQNLASQLKARVIHDYEPQVTHVIAGLVEGHRCARTVKYLKAVLQGCWVVNVQWLSDSAREKRWLPELPYELEGDTSGVGGPRKGRLNREKKLPPLFDGCQFYIKCPKDLPAYGTARDLVLTGGGTVLVREPGTDADALVPYHAANRSPWPPIVVHVDTAEPLSGYADGLRHVHSTWIPACISNFTLQPLL